MLGNKSFWRRMFQGTKVPTMELLFPGTKVVGYESFSYRCLVILYNHPTLFHKPPLPGTCICVKQLLVIHALCSVCMSTLYVVQSLLVMPQSPFSCKKCKCWHILYPDD